MASASNDDGLITNIVDRFATAGGDQHWIFKVGRASHTCFEQRRQRFELACL